MKIRRTLALALALLLAMSLFAGATLAEDELNKFVLTPKNETGTYGGTLYAAFPTGYQGQAYETLGFYEPVLTWNEDVSEQLPNIVEVFEQSEDAATFRMTIRKGLKWSDGTPVTTEDIRYVYEDVWQNTDLMSAPPSNFCAGGELCKLNVVDEATFELVFAQPNPWFKYVICRQGNTGTLFVPSHYMRQFNNKYASEEDLAKLAAEANLDSWEKLYDAKGKFIENPELPTLFAWTLKSVSEDNTVRVFERNENYFKFDDAGNRLPYLDGVQVEYVDNSETLKLKVMAGEVDYIFAPTGETFSEWPVLAQNAEAGDYRLVLASGDYPHIFLVEPNMSSQDPQKGPLFADKNFRIALSQAINRSEFIDLLVSVADFKGTPAQQSPVEESPFYNEKLATQYLEYDPAKANELLDGIGLTARDADGYRLGLDGEKLAIQITIPTYNDLWVDGGLLIAEYWKAVGINAEVKAVSPDIWNQLNTANELEVSIHSSGSGGMMVINSDGVDAYAVPYAGWTQRYATAYGQYVGSNGESGIEPTEDIKRLNELRLEILAEADPEIAAQKVDEMMNLFADIFPIIGICRPLPMFLVCSNSIGNGPDDHDAWVTFAYGVGGNVNPCQFYKK